MSDTPDLIEQQVEYSRRVEPRFKTRGIADLIETQGLETRRATILDVSRSGLQVEIGAPVDIGARVEIRLSTVSVFGQIGYCREHASGCYRLGIRTDRVITRP